MKIAFEDGSFIDFDRINEYLNITTCAVDNSRKKVTMSTVELKTSDIEKLFEFLKNILDETAQISAE